MVGGIWGQTRCFDVRCTDRERSTFNVQRSTFSGVAERAHGGRDMGTDTMFPSPCAQKGVYICTLSCENKLARRGTWWNWQTRGT